MNNITTAATYTASGGTVYLGYTIEAWGFTAILVGIFFTIATFVINVWFQKHRLKIAEKK